MKSRPKPKLPNGHRAVMASRKEGKDSLDPFWTPPWATRALCQRVLPHLGYPLCRQRVKKAWEPACGEGHMAEVLKEYFGYVRASDIHDYGYAEQICDFLDAPWPRSGSCHWIITNPPFGKQTIPFILRALEQPGDGVAMFVRLQLLEGVGRYEQIFRDRPPTLFAPFVERVNLCRGRWEPKGSTATAYCWLVWLSDKRGKLAAPRPTFWIPPGQRKALSRPDDQARFAAWSLPLQEAAE